MTKSQLQKNYQELVDILGEGRVKIDEPLSQHTTFKIGGPTDLFYSPSSEDDLALAVQVATGLNIPFFIIGAGANLLISDAGFRGIVISPKNKNIEIVSKEVGEKKIKTKSGARYGEHHNKEGFLKLEDLEYEDPPFDTILKVGAGVTLPFLISWTLDRGLTGLEYFSGIPATVGGAIYNNIHGGTRLMIDRLKAITLLCEDGRVRKVEPEHINGGYDYTSLHETKDVILSAEIYVSSNGDIESARYVAKEWKKRKMKVQPQTNCPGCVFKNLSEQDQQRSGFPTSAAGYIIDQKLGWKGKKVGGVKISEKHANFMVNTGNGTAADVLELIHLIQTEVKKRFDVILDPEIFFVGFD